MFNLYIRIRNAMIVRYYVFKYKLYYRDQITFGKGFSCKYGLRIHISKGGELIFGDGVFLNNSCSINVGKKITIGNNTIIGENVKLYDHNHNFRNKELLIREQGLNYGQININDNCWIGSNVTILKNVNVGYGTIIGAGVTVYKDIPAYQIVINKQEIIMKEY